MNIYQLKKNKEKVYPALLIDTIFSIEKRDFLRKILFYTLFFSFILIFLSFIFKFEIFSKYQILLFFVKNTYLFRSLFLFFFSLWMSMYLLEMMYIYYYFKKTDVDFEVLKICNNLYQNDITKSFLDSDLGKITMIRMGILKKDIEDFINTRTNFVSEKEYEIIENDDNNVSFSEFGYSLIHFDNDFRNLLKKKGITLKDFKKVMDWVKRYDIKLKKRKIWWSKENLEKIPTIGRNWDFGRTYFLDKFGHIIFDDPSFIHLGNKYYLFENILEKIESILLKEQGADLLMVSKETDFSMKTIASLGKKILRGNVNPYLENKKIYILDINVLLSVYDDGTSFQNMLQSILYESASVGNIILVIPHISDFVENSSRLGVDIKDILSDFMNSNKINIIATVSNSGFHSVIETDLDLMKNFEKLIIEDFNTENIIEYIEDEVEYIERHNSLIFSYQAIKKIIESASRYFSESSLSDKVIDILDEVASHCVLKDKIFVFEEDVDEIIYKKAGISIGLLNKNEKDKLNNIEKELKNKIIGQDYAIESITKALKRARMGIANPQRPLGSFLFIGPTGVGKTETCKALIDVFFEKKESLIRLDMSEYSDFNALNRLIGGSSIKGILSSKIKEKKSGLLLLDEFEKSSPEVHNLFLQILDEGFFSDGFGEKVDVRNFIIIGTSNAGSDLIYNLDIQIPVYSIKDNLINYLITNNIFKSEFLNRFDDIILFNSLSESDLNKIVEIMIKKLNERLDDKGLNIKINEEIVNFLVEKGKNKKFGAREINRIIQNEIEAKIADSLISGNIEKGDTITFNVDLETDNIEINKIL